LYWAEKLNRAENCTERGDDCCNFAALKSFRRTSVNIQCGKRKSLSRCYFCAVPDQDAHAQERPEASAKNFWQKMQRFAVFSNPAAESCDANLTELPGAGR
jgi:hypothetical protein